MPDILFEAPNLIYWAIPAFILLFFAEDFSYYWFHRISHGCRFFWVSHVVHQRLAYVFGPPGWSHDGSRKTTEELGAEWRARHVEAP